MHFWIDTHCHLDAQELSQDIAAVRARASRREVVHCVLPAVSVGNFDAVRLLAHKFGDSYALGIHPVCIAQAQEADLQALDAELALRLADPRLVAVGEIGLDYFVPALNVSPLRERQEFFYREQLKLARKHGLPVILQLSENCANYHGSFDPLARSMLELARNSAASVAVHLDHAEDLDLAFRAIDAGFSSVMYDGSKLDSRMNVAATQRVVDYARTAGALVEAELGAIGGKDGAHAPGVRTDPAEAKSPSRTKYGPLWNSTAPTSSGIRKLRSA